MSSALLLNIGNTHTQVALSRAAGRVRLLGTVATADLKPGRPFLPFVPAGILYV